MSKIVEVTATIRLKISDKLSEELVQSESLGNGESHDFVLRNCFHNNDRVVLDANVVEKNCFCIMEEDTKEREVQEWNY